MKDQIAANLAATTFALVCCAHRGSAPRHLHQGHAR